MRRVDRAIALVGGLVLAVAAVLAGIEVMELILGNPPLIIPRHRWDGSLSRSHWGSFGMELASGIVAGVGVVLIILQIIRRRPVRLALRSRPQQRTWVSRRGLGRRLTHDVSEVDEIDQTKVRVSRNRVRTKIVVTPGADRSAGVNRVGAVVHDTLGSIGVVRDLKVRVVARSTPGPSGSRTQ
ncbi:MAG: DUF6286 domain-containing protein [Actinomycetota bacterium]|nr:DUF6286 domain-containing protein [Actinomycetota bacterium]